MIFGINTTCYVSKLSQFTRLTVREITYNNFAISLQIMLLPILIKQLQLALTGWNRFKRIRQKTKTKTNIQHLVTLPITQNYVLTRNIRTETPAISKTKATTDVISRQEEWFSHGLFL